jgi:putative oxidoreductase
MRSVFLLGRIVFGGFFFYNGINHFKARKAMAQYAAAKGIPSPEAAVIASGAALTLGGLSVILGLKPKLGITSLLGFLGTVSPIMHDFWNQDDPQTRQNEIAHFGKNMALLGAALALAGTAKPWPASLKSE